VSKRQVITVNRITKYNFSKTQKQNKKWKTEPVSVYAQAPIMSYCTQGWRFSLKGNETEDASCMVRTCRKYAAVFDCMLHLVVLAIIFINSTPRPENGSFFVFFSGNRTMTTHACVLKCLSLSHHLMDLSWLSNLLLNSNKKRKVVCGHRACELAQEFYSGIGQTWRATGGKCTPTSGSYNIYSLAEQEVYKSIRLYTWTSLFLIKKQTNKKLWNNSDYWRSKTKGSKECYLLGQNTKCDFSG